MAAGWKQAPTLSRMLQQLAMGVRGCTHCNMLRHGTAPFFFALLRVLLCMWAGRAAGRGVPPPMQMDEALVQPILAAMRGMVGARVRAHAGALWERQVIQCKSTQWLTRWLVTERSL